MSHQAASKLAVASTAQHSTAQHGMAQVHQQSKSRSAEQDAQLAAWDSRAQHSMSHGLRNTTFSVT